jgi:hypothetical protein
MEAEISNYSEELAVAYYAGMKKRWDRSSSSPGNPAIRSKAESISG